MQFSFELYAVHAINAVLTIRSLCDLIKRLSFGSKLHKTEVRLYAIYAIFFSKPHLLNKEKEEVLTVKR